MRLLSQIAKGLFLAGKRLSDWPGIQYLIQGPHVPTSNIAVKTTGDILLRWVNYHLHRSGVPLQVRNFGSDFKVSRWCRKRLCPVIFVPSFLLLSVPPPVVVITYPPVCRNMIFIAVGWPSSRTAFVSAETQFLQTTVDSSLGRPSYLCGQPVRHSYSCVELNHARAAAGRDCGQLEGNKKFLG